MKKIRNTFSILFSGLFLLHCSPGPTQYKAAGNTLAEEVLPLPYATKSAIKESVVIGWPEGKTPLAPEGFQVSVFTDQIKSPRWIYEAPNGDILVSSSLTDLKKSPNIITLLRNDKKSKTPFKVGIFLKDLHQPLGMLILNEWFYVANTDGVYRYPYKIGQSEMTDSAFKILDLPAGGYNNHWTRNIIANPEGTKLYVSVGSGSNNGENGLALEVGRAVIIEMNPDGTGSRIFASGLRNAVGMDWQPETKILWAAVNERDELGDELVPDFLSSIVDGGFYGWPYAYFGPNEDPRMKGLQPDLVKKTLVPDVNLGAHTASLGLAFYSNTLFPQKYKNGAFIGQHGSWNRSSFSGYKVAFVPFNNNLPGKPENFLTGFIADENLNEVYGRPVGVYVTSDGNLLVADDAGNRIWKVTYTK